MNCLKLGKDKTIDYKVMKNVRNLFKLKKGEKVIKSKVIEAIRNLFEL